MEERLTKKERDTKSEALVEKEKTEWGTGEEADKQIGRRKLRK